MSRKKQEDVEVNKEEKEFVYCGLRKCIHTECLRHNVNTPFGVIIRRRKFSPDKDWNCKDMEV